MINITIDNNLLIDLEEKRTPHFKDILRLQELHNNKKIKISIPAILASENASKSNKGRKIETFDDFIHYIKDLDFNNPKILKAMAYTEVSFSGASMICSEKCMELEEEIHNIVASASTPLKQPQNKWDKWVNVKCDVQVVWAHIWNKTDYLATRDTDILNKSNELEELGANIVNPKEMLSRID